MKLQHPSRYTLALISEHDISSTYSCGHVGGASEARSDRDGAAVCLRLHDLSSSDIAVSAVVPEDRVD